MNQFYTATDNFVLMPAIMLALFGCAVLLFDFFVFKGTARRWMPVFALAGLGFTAYALWRQWVTISGMPTGELTAFRASLVVDRFALVFNWLFLAASALVIAISWRWHKLNEAREGDHQGEWYGLILLANCGMFFLATGVDLITLFVGLELMALCFYVLVGFNREDKKSNEAAMKYLLLGAFSSGFLAYGMSLMYGISGSTKLAPIAAAIAGRGAFDPIVLMAVTTASVGLLFKISAVPFHMWAPDAYEGAPTPVTAYLSVASKAASFALLVRMFQIGFGTARESWLPILSVVAVLSLIVGNFAAITQTSVKRMLAYSSISHAGYILFGLIAGNQTGIRGMLVYLSVYAFMTMGAFIVLAALQRERRVTVTTEVEPAVAAPFRISGGPAVLEQTQVVTETRTEVQPADDIDDFNGLFHRHPAYAAWMLFFLLSLAGIPPTAGFIGKWYIFLALIEANMVPLAVIGVLFAAVSLYYYFRIVKAMFMSEASDTAPVSASRAWGYTAAVGVCGLVTLGLGIWAEPVLRFTDIFGR